MASPYTIKKPNALSLPFDTLDAISYPLSAFGNLQANGGFNADGSFVGTDNTAVFNAAASSGEWVRVPPGRYRMSGQATFSGATTKLWGEQFVLANDVNAGAWILRDEPAVPAFLIGGEYPATGTTPFTSGAVSSSIHNLGFIEAHPVPSLTPGTPWTPTDYAPCIQVDNLFGSFDIGDIMGLWCSRLLEIRSNGHGDIGRLHGQCFRSMLQMSDILDECELRSIRNWTYKSSNPNVLDWQRANLDLLQLGRVDGLVITGRVSGFGCRSLLHASEEVAVTGQAIASANTPGGASSVQGGKFAGDQCQTAIWLDGLQAAQVNRTFQLDSLVCNGYNGANSYLPNSRAILMNTSGGVEIQCPSVSTFYYPGEAILVQGDTNSLQFGASRFKGHNLAVSRGAAPAGTAAAPAIILEPTTSSTGFRNQAFLGSSYVVDAGASLLFDTIAGSNAVKGWGAPPCYDGRPLGETPLGAIVLANG